MRPYILQRNLHRSRSHLLAQSMSPDPSELRPGVYGLSVGACGMPMLKGPESVCARKRLERFGTMR